MARVNSAEEDMRQFNYYGQVSSQGAPNIEEFTEEEVLKLEREVEELLRNRVTSAADLGAHGSIVNINSGKVDFRATKSAHVGKRQNLMMSAAYGGQQESRRSKRRPKQQAEYASGGNNIYEDFPGEEDLE